MPTVHNLRTGEQCFYSCSPREAVIAAYAQEKEDWSTWEYQDKYDYLVEEGAISYGIGDWAVMKENVDV